MKFTDKLKKFEIPKAGDLISNAKQSVSSVFDKKDEGNTTLSGNEVSRNFADKLHKLSESADEWRGKATSFIAESGDKLEKWSEDTKADCADKLHKLSESADEWRGKATSFIAESGDKLEKWCEDTKEDNAERLQKLSESADELREKVANYLSENGEKLQKWYSDSKMNEKIVNVGKRVGATVLYPVLILYNLFRSPNTGIGDKMVIISPLAYFILPTDIIPDIIAGFGYVDDASCVMTSLKKLSSSITLQIQDQAKSQCKELLGEIDETVLEKVSSAINENKDAIAASIEQKISEKQKSDKKKK